MRSTHHHTNMMIYFMFICWSQLSSCVENTTQKKCKWSRGKDFGINETYSREYDFFFDLDSALACSKFCDRKLLLIFSGISGNASFDAQFGIFRNEKIKDLIINNFVPVILYCDEPTNGNRYYKLLTDSFHRNTTPCYGIVDTNLNRLEYNLSKISIKDDEIMILELEKWID